LQCIKHKQFIPVLRFCVFYFLIFFPAFLFYKTLSNAKYEHAKIHRETLLEDASAVIFIDF